jgi:hypothetical protein
LGVRRGVPRLIATMFGRFYAYWEEDSPRIVVHYTAAFALLVLLLLKLP